MCDYFYMKKSLFKHKIINIGDRTSAINFLSNLENNKSQNEYKIINLGLTKLNRVCKGKLFRQEAAYVDYSTLKDAMTEVGGKGHHNYHGLTPSEIVDSLRSVKNSGKVYESKNNQDTCIIVSSIIAECGCPIIVIIALNNTLYGEKNLKINKIASLYPKRNLESFLTNLKLK